MLLDIVTISIATIALIVSILSYRHARTVKATDLRIEAKRARAELQEAFVRLKNSHSTALRARKALNAARGLLNSSATQNYEKTWAENRHVIDRLERESAQIAEPDAGSGPKHLEEIIVTVHGIRTRVDSLQSQYDQDAAHNEREIVQLREDRRSAAKQREGQ